MRTTMVYNNYLSGKHTHTHITSKYHAKISFYPKLVHISTETFVISFTVNAKRRVVSPILMLGITELSFNEKTYFVIKTCFSLVLYV